MRDASRGKPEFEPELGRDDFSLNGTKHLAHSRCLVNICWICSTLLNRHMQMGMSKIDAQ